MYEVNERLVLRVNKLKRSRNNTMKTVYTALILIGMAMVSTTKAQDSTSEKVYYKDTETLPYSVEETLGENIEIRSYPEAIAVASKGNDNTGAFRLLFNYISGANQASQELSMTSPVEMPTASASTEIAMTSPVEMSSAQGMMFFLPNQFTAENAPRPTHPDVELVVIDARRVASITYSGFNDNDKRKAYLNTLLKVLEDNGYRVSGNPSFLGYDAPFTLPWNKRHEVIIEVKSPPVSN